MGKALIDFNEFTKFCRAKFSDKCMVGSYASCSEINCKIFKDYQYKKAECSCVEILDDPMTEPVVVIDSFCEVHLPLLEAFRTSRDGIVLNNGLKILYDTPRFKIVQEHNAIEKAHTWVVMIYGTERCAYLGNDEETTYHESDAKRFHIKDEAAAAIFELNPSLRPYAVLVKAFNEYPMLPFKEGF